MAFLKEQLKNQFKLEMDVKLDEFLEQNNISDDAIIHTMIFDKSVFAEEKEVREYLQDKYMWDPQITQNENDFIAVIANPAQMDLDTEIEVEIRRGVRAKAADLFPVMSFENIEFNDKGEINLSSKFGTINLSENAPQIIEICRVAEGEHAQYGKIKITEEDLISMESNFKSKVTGVDLSINEDHKKNEAFGWFKDVFRSFDGQVLYGQISWNRKGTTALSEKEYRYFSPEFRFNYKHPHTGTEHGPTLLGGALTNYPFLKMDAIVELNNSKPPKGDEPMSEKTIELSVHNEKVIELSQKVSEANAKAETAEAKNVELSEKVKELEEKVEMAEKKSVHEKLFNEGKINKAQLDAMNEGKSLLEVISLNEKMNTSAAGGDKNKEEETIELNSKEKEVCNLLGLTEEEFVKYNK